MLDNSETCLEKKKNSSKKTDSSRCCCRLALIHPLTPSALNAFSAPSKECDTTAITSSSSLSCNHDGAGLLEPRIPVMVTALDGIKDTKKTQSMMMDQICMLEKKHWAKSQSWGDQCMRMISKPNTHVIAIYVDDETVIGYCIVSCQSLCGTVSKMFVRKEYRKLRLGTFMLSKTLEYISRLKDAANRPYSIMLFVEFENRAAQGLYQKLGFEKENLLKDYYNVGSHAYRMIKS